MTDADRDGAIVSRLRPCDGEAFRARLESFETWLWAEAPALLSLVGATPEPALVAERVLELSDLYTLDRAGFAAAARHRRHLTAKLLYFLCSDAPKVRLVLEELGRRHGGPPLRDPGTARWVDLGCGLGATSVGAVLSLPDGVDHVSITLVDLDPVSLDIAAAAVRAAASIVGVDVTVEAHQSDLSAWEIGEGTDLVLCQAALNELGQESSGGAPGSSSTPLDEQVGRWTDGRWCVLVEPALRVTTRPLHALRDRLLDQGRCAVLAPCPHQLACPMLTAERDWCHEMRRIDPPPMVAAVQRLTRRRDDRTKFSFVVLGPRGDGQPLPVNAADVIAGRLVSDPLRTKGKTERVLCTTEGDLVRLRLLDRERRDANEDLADARRGVLVAVSGDTGTPRIGPDATVRRIGAAASAPLDRSTLPASDRRR